MPTTPLPVESAIPVPDPDTQRHRAWLDDMIALGVDITRMIHKQIKAQAEAAQDDPAATIAPSLPNNFDTVTRSVRKSMLLFRELATPAFSVEQHRRIARQTLIRGIEDNIHRHAPTGKAASLHREMLDRLDAPDLDDDLATRPVAEILTEICRDLGLAATPLSDPWQRRTPADIATLKARAAARAGTIQVNAADPPQHELHRIRGP